EGGQRRVEHGQQRDEHGLDEAEEGDGEEERHGREDRVGLPYGRGRCGLRRSVDGRQWAVDGMALRFIHRLTVRRLYLNPHRTPRRLTRRFRAMRLAHLDLGDRPLLLAPMEDVSDPPFRILCKRYGADLLYTEFISSGGLVYGADDSVHKLEFYEEERPLAIQIFGGEEDQVREAARIVDAQGPDLIDINFGCPVRKVVCKD